MLQITVAAATSATPQQVLVAATDFSAHRAKIWPNVTAKRLEVHARGSDWVEVTEGATGIAWFAWERSRYDWSEPGRVMQTALDSNVVEPGSTWELRLAPGADGGCEVQMELERRFRRTAAGRYGSGLNRLAGRVGWGFMLRNMLKAVEREPAASSPADAANAAA